jgi:hypothetical protein
MNPFMSAPFRQFGANTTISASTTTAGGALARVANQVATVCNVGSVTIFVKFGAGSQTATNADMAVAPNTVRVFQLVETDTHVAAITASSTATVYVGVGDGTVT